MSELIFELDGYIGKNIKVYEDKCIISCEATFGSILTSNAVDGAKTIYYSDVTGIQFKEASAFLIGFLQLETSSGSIKSGRTQITDENSFSYGWNDVPYDTMKKVYSFIQERVEYYKTMKRNPAAVVASSAPDELKKWKELLDMEIITQAEFNAKKKQLLGLSIEEVVSHNAKPENLIEKVNNNNSSAIEISTIFSNEDGSGMW